MPTDRQTRRSLWVRPEHKDAVLERLLTSTGLSMRHPPGMALVELVLGLHGEELGTHKLNHAGIFKQVECAPDQPTMTRPRAVVTSA